MPSTETEEKKINGGYIYLARQILDSDIFHEKPPEWLKIWIYILLSVNYENGRRFSRGTRYFCWDDEKRNLQGVTKWQWHDCIRFLKKEKMITTQKTTRGNLIKVLQYGRYQSPKFYKTKAQTKARTHDKLTTNSDRPKHNQSINQSTFNKNQNKNQSTFNKNQNKNQSTLQQTANTQPTRNQHATKARPPEPAPDHKLTPPLMKELKKERMKERTTILSQIENLLSHFPNDTKLLIKEYIELAKEENKTKKITDLKHQRLLNELYNIYRQTAPKEFKIALRITIDNAAPHPNYIKKVLKSRYRQQKARRKKNERDPHN